MKTRAPILLALSLAYALNVWPQEQILRFKEDSFDFGALKIGEQFERVFELVNHGEQPLKILKVYHCCGCVAEVVGSTTIGPGQAGQLRVKCAASEAGQFERAVYVSTEDPVIPLKAIRIRGRVEKQPQEPQASKARWLRFKKQAYDLGRVKGGQIVEHTFEVANEGSDVVRILSVQALYGAEAELIGDGDIKPGEARKIRVRFDTSGRSGKMDIVVRLYTTDPGERITHLYLSLQIDTDN